MSDIIRISELTAGSPPYAGSTLFEISIDAGAGSWLTRRASMTDIVATVGAGLGLTPKAAAGSPVVSTTNNQGVYPASTTTSGWALGSNFDGGGAFELWNTTNRYFSFRGKTGATYQDIAWFSANDPWSDLSLYSGAAAENFTGIGVDTSLGEGYLATTQNRWTFYTAAVPGSGAWPVTHTLHAGGGGRSYNLFTDAANYEAAYLGDWSANVARYGTAMAGTGVARDVSLVRGGTEQLRLSATGPTAPTQLAANNSTLIATTAYVKSQAYITGNQTITVTGDVDGSGTTAITLTLDTVNANVGTFQGLTVNAKGLVTAAVNQGYAPLASPVFTGDPRSVTPLTADNDTSIATTAYVKAQLYITGNEAITLSGDATGSGTTAIAVTLASVATPGTFQGITFNAKGLVTSATNMAYAPLASPTFTGTPAAPTATAGVSTTQIATTAFVATSFATTASLAAYAPLASPTLTGIPVAPTAAAATNTTQIATTAYVKSQNYLTGNQSITISGDADGSGTTAITLTLDTVNANVGTFQGLTVNAKGLVTAASNMAYAPLASPTLTGIPVAPTATAGTNTTQIATTAFVASAVATGGGAYVPLTGGTMTGALAVVPGGEGRHLSTSNWADMSGSGVSGKSVFGNNVYVGHLSSLFTYPNTHGGIGAMGLAFNQPVFNSVSIITSGTTTSTAGATFTPIAVMTLTSGSQVGIKHTNPQANLHIGTTTGTARIYQGYTDTANGTWAYLGDWGKLTNIATYGTDFNGTGAARGVDILAGGALGLRIDSVGRFGFGAAPVHYFDVAGLATSTASMYFHPDHSSSGLSDTWGIYLAPQVTPTGATLGNYWGMMSGGFLHGTSAISNYIGVGSRLSLNADFTGTVTNGYAFFATAPVINSPATPFDVFTAFYVATNAHGNGLITGTVTNRGLYIVNGTAGSAGGTVQNESIRCTVPSGSPTSGVTYNYGIVIAGNGGTATGGTVGNAAIWNSSTADVYLSAGRVGIKSTAPQSDLHVGATAGTARVYNLFPNVTNTEFAYIGDWGLTANVASFGTGKLGTGLTRNLQFVVGGVVKADYGIGTAGQWTFTDPVNVPGGLALTTPLAIASGGTGASTAATARTNLGAAPLDAPAFTGIPTAATAAAATNTTQLATTAYVKSQAYISGNQTITITGDGDGSGTTAITLTLDTVNANVGTFQGLTVNAKGLVTAAVNQGYAPLASPVFTGNPTGPTPSIGDNDTSLATTAFVATSFATIASLSAYAPIASPGFTGVPTAPTPAPGINSAQLATTAFVVTSFAPLASPTLTGIPVAPTATAGTNTTQIATTAFVTGALGTAVPTFTTGSIIFAGPGLSQDNANLFWDNTNDRLGVGTITPRSKLNIYGTGQTTADINTTSGDIGNMLVVQSSSIAVGDGGGIVFGTRTSATDGLFAAIKSLITSAANNSVGHLAFSTRTALTDSTLTEKMRIDYLGNVGIGHTAPLGKLHIRSATAGGAITPHTTGDELVIEGSSSSGLTIITPDAYAARLMFADQTSNTVGQIIYNHADDSMQFAVNGVERARFIASGFLGILSDAPQTMLQVGETAGSFRVSNLFTDASNGEWFEATWAANTLYLGTQKLGSGAARAMVIRAGGIPAINIEADADVHIPTHLSINTTPSTSLLTIGGTWTSAGDRLIQIAPVIVSSVTAGQFSIVNAPTFQPAVPISIIYGAWNNAAISAACTVDIATQYSHYSGITTTAGYTGTVTNGVVFLAFATQGAGNKPFTNYTAFLANATSNGNGLAVGTVTNWGLRVQAFTAAAALGGTVLNYGSAINVPSGSGAGTTANYGMFITGNGGTINAGTTNYALYSDSTAPSLLMGHFGLGSQPTFDLAYAPTMWISGNGPALYLNETDAVQAFSLSVLSGSFYIRNATTPVAVLGINPAGLIGIGGTFTSAYPALKRSATELQVRLADDSYYAPLASSSLALNGLGELSSPHFGFGHYQNLLRWSEDFSNVLWTDPLARWSVISTTAIAPNGEASASTVSSDIAGGIIRHVVTVTDATTYTFSIWARLGTATVSLSVDLGDGVGAFFQPTTVWQRFKVALVAGTADYIDISLNGLGTYEFWGAQLEAGSDMGPYVKTQATAASTVDYGIVLPTLTPGSILFAGPSGALTQNNANLFWDDTNNRLGIGTAVPGMMLDALSTTGRFYFDHAQGFNLLQRSTADASGSAFIARKTRGNTTTPAVVTSGDHLFLIRAYGHDGAGYFESGRITFYATGTIATGIVPGGMLLQTTNAAGVLSNALTFTHEAAATFTPTCTTALGLSVTASSLTTGSVARFYSNSADTGVRSLVNIWNDNTLSSGATVLRLQQDSIADILNVFDGAVEVFTILDGGNVGIGTDTPASPLHISGPTLAANYVTLDTTLTTAGTGNAIGIQIGPTTTLNSTGTVGGVWGINSAPHISGASGTLSVSNFIAVQGTLQLDAGFAGFVANARNFYGADVSNATGRPAAVTVFNAFHQTVITNGQGLTAGSVSNRSFLANGITAATGVGTGTITNAGVYIVVSNGASTGGTTTNYGMLITGNGGVATGGVTSNWAIYNNSTADVYLSAGKVGIKANIPQADLHVGVATGTARVYRTQTGVTDGEWAYIGDWGKTSLVATYGTDNIGTGLVRNIQFTVGGVVKANYGITTAGRWTFVDPINAPGGTMSNGLDFGAVLAASTTDLTKHLLLHTAGYGFGVTSGRMNYVVAAAGVHGFIVGGAEEASITSTGLTLSNPLTIANGGTGAITAGAALTALGAAPLASPTFTGVPAAPTAAAATNTTQLATTAFATTADNLRVLKAGDTMTGALSITPASGPANIVLGKPAAAGGNNIYGYTGANARWQMEMGSAAAETGGNVGSDFAIHRFADNAAYLGTSLSINRATGLATFTNTLSAAQYNLAGIAFASTDGTTLYICDATGAGAIALQAANNYYDADTHYFRTNAGLNRLTINSSGMMTAVGAVIAGNATLTGIVSNSIAGGHLSVGQWHGLNAYHNGTAFTLITAGYGGYWNMDMASGYLHCVLANTTAAAGAAVAGLTVRISLSSTGSCLNTTGTWGLLSDASIKSNIQPYKRGLDAILALEPVTYQYNAKSPFGDEGIIRFGLVADQVQPHIPEVVGTYVHTPTDPEGREMSTVELLTLDPGMLTYALINAIKELAAEVAALKAAR